MERHWGKAARELGIGIGASVVALAAVLVATPFAVELALALVVVGVASWVRTTDRVRLALGAGPVTVLFAGVVLGLAAAIGLFVETQRPMMLVIAVLFAGTGALWVARILPR